jgi:hypothetical protein
MEQDIMLTAAQTRDAIETGLEIASRWPSLLLVLGFDQRPSPASLNDALQARGFGRIVDERSLPLYSDDWWTSIAREVTGRPDAKVEDVVSKLRAAKVLNGIA